ncbi:carbohydrate ABC transporter permease [Aureibacillus halotolerans]|uniref:Carbohydrate ABC transporter membrane protein 1 (CUT1 family) n=1 Tax=Aureibacillus halotolerans TaxID=1508390 RepID=A0A4R6TSY2_9BACI|nr:sugar ABC transporter permease [Aureibacillus halotolerans]TDQ36768.1 carbohydrate ABC transporter membrane protein 1 (CUT1 family) [Aureibacillus halotolerans]
MISTDKQKQQNVPKKSGLSEKTKDRLSAYLYISPFFLIFSLVGLYPAVFSLYLSFHRWDGLTPMTSAGLNNFKIVLEDPLFWKALSNTLIIGIMGTAPQLVVGILLAFLLNLSVLKMKHFFRVTIFMPYITSLVAVALVFSVFFSNNETALANYILSLFGMEPINWKTSEWGTKVAISLMVFWRWVGYNTIIYLAGLQSIPKDLYEAATIDGASRPQQLRFITLPLLKPFITLTVFFSTVGALQLFAEPTVFLGNAAFSRDEAMTIVMYLYRDAFQLQSYGTASATAVILLIIIVTLAAINTFLSSGIGRQRRVRK